eukprot:5507322-Amphidinium_carterae.1
MAALHSLVSASPLAAYTNIQLNTLNAGKRIRMLLDGKDCGQSYAISFGDFDGGLLQLQDADGTARQVFSYKRWIRVAPSQYHGVTRVTEDMDA